MTGKRLPDEVYNPRWLARITSMCIRSDTGCLLWTGIRTYNGYAQNQYRGKTKMLHRVMYQLVNKVTLPSDIDVCHSCDVRHCIEPSHLWTGTRKQNMEDCTSKGRHGNMLKTACVKGHEFTEENTYVDKTGKRNCRACARIRQRIEMGWTQEQAKSLPVTPHGHRPVNATRS